MELSLFSLLSIGIILGAPLLAQYKLPFTIFDNIFLRLLLVGYVFYGIRQGPLEGLFAFLAVFTILVERNHQTLIFLPGQTPTWPTRSQMLSTPSQAIPITPTLESHFYEDHGNDHAIDQKYTSEEPVGLDTGLESSAGTRFESASELEDNIPRLPEGPHSASDAEYYEAKGFA